MLFTNRLYYFSPYDLQKPRTNQISDVHFCEGMQEAGCNMTLFVPTVFRKENVPRKDIFKAYGVHVPFRIRYLTTPAFDDISGSFIMNIMALYHFFIFISTPLVPVKRRPWVISRNPRILMPLLITRKLLPFIGWPGIILWVHELKLHNRWLNWVYKNSDKVLCTNSAIREDLEQIVGIDSQKVCVTLNPVTSIQANEPINKEIARQRLEIKPETQLVVYTGKLFIGQSEAEFIIDAAASLKNYQFILTGGKPHVVEYYREYCRERVIPNVSFTGYLYDYTDIRYYQYAADVLVSYYTEQEHSIRYNFPQKVVEYMLAGNPIVTPDFAATRDVLSDDNAIFVEEENVASLVNGIKQAFSEESKEKGKLAQTEARDITFLRMARRVVTFLSA